MFNPNVNQMFNVISRINKSLYFLNSLNRHKINLGFIHYFCNDVSKDRPARILGIETSCDETGVAIVDGNGKILGEALNSQMSIHLKAGGIYPTVANELHKKNIQDVYEKALKSAQMMLEDVDAVATTVKPGLPFSLKIGKDFGKKIALETNKPFIPIHHMEAHALTARMVEKVDFPYLTLLISGGHCLLALVESVSKFYKLGTTLDDAPGEAFDKTARRLRMINIPEYQNVSGGQAIEIAASKATNPLQFDYKPCLVHYRDCNFSFSGLKTAAIRHIQKQELKYNIPEDGIIPDLNNLCASFQWAVARQIANKTKRAMIFLNYNDLLPFDNKTLVISGGVACNHFIAKVLKIVCDEMEYRFIRPPPKLCTDNGIMIAWNGVERWRANDGVLRDHTAIEKIDLEGKSPLGEDWSKKVVSDDIQCKSMKHYEVFPEFCKKPNNV